MDRYFTKTFYRFLTGFLVVLSIAFGVIVLAAQSAPVTPTPVDNTASSK